MHDNRDDPAFPATYSSHRPGITLRQLAALILRVTDSGTAWMDEMIVRATERQSEDLTLLPPQPTAVRAKQDYCDQQELRVIAEEVWNHGMPPVRKTPEQVFDFAIRFLAAVVERQEPVKSRKVAKQDWHDQQELKAVRELNRELAIPGMIGSPAWYDAMRRAFNPAPQPTERQEPIVITTGMVYSFHNSISDGAISADEFEDIKTGLKAALANVTHPAPQPTGWQPIETAPKDGTHILVRSLIGSEPPTVCHWFDGGWHLSVNRNGDDSEFQAAFWREI